MIRTKFKHTSFTLTSISLTDYDHYESECAALDRQIDALVYELYELTPEEIVIVEASE